MTRRKATKFPPMQCECCVLFVDVEYIDSVKRAVIEYDGITYHGWEALSEVHGMSAAGLRTRARSGHCFKQPTRTTKPPEPHRATTVDETGVAALLNRWAIASASAR